jgi:hypothetical protein
MNLIAATLALLLTQEADPFGLSPGNEWVYRLSNGAVLTTRVTGTAKLKGVECAVVESVAPGQTSREYLAVTAEGLKAFKGESPFQSIEYDPPILRAKLPFKKGETWTATVQEGAVRNTYQYAWEGTETLPVAGTPVECLKLTTTLDTPQGRVTSTAWYGKGVGLVRQVYAAGGQTLTAELAKTNVAPKAPAPAGGADFVRYESKDGKTLLYHPKGWKVADGAMFGEGTYSVTVDSPDDTAAALFMTFAVNEQLKDSMELAKLLLGNLAKTYPDLAVSEMKATKDRARTTAAVSYTNAGKKLAGHLYFFHSGRAGTVYALMARQDLWEASRPALASIVANLAYAPEGAAAVLRKGNEQAAAAAPPPQEKSLHPAALIKDAFARAAKGEGREVPMDRVAAQDQSFAMEVPRGWTFQGAGLAATAVSDARNLHGYSSLMYTVFVPGGAFVQTPDLIVSPYRPPAQALAFLMQRARLATDLRVLSATTILELDPSYAEKVWKPALAAGAQVDNRLMLVEFTNATTGTVCRGLASVTCTAWPLGTSWTCSVDSSWAPAAEYDRWLPVFARMAESSKQNAQWVQQKFSDQAAESARLNRNLMKSINETSQAYDRYNQSWWDSQKSRDYTSWAWSQTTLGQGSWVSEREGAAVVRSDRWGLENLETGQRTSAWNQTNFSGRNPWSGEQLNEVDTRAEYERFIRGR